jgi:hypothetical protein
MKRGCRKRKTEKGNGDRRRESGNGERGIGNRKGEWEAEGKGKSNRGRRM